MVYRNIIVFLFTIKFTLGISSPIINTSHGKLEGIWTKTQLGRNYASFLGIPFASPPVGANRFMDPQPLRPWNGVLSAKKYSSACLQYDVFAAQVTGIEDCLYLNVFTVDTNKTAALPVIIFIHGGGLISGVSFQYDPIRLMEMDVVVVTMNYRLGPLGFLSTGDTVVPGNAGLKDQAVALQWVKRNIESFGGDPNSITLTGQSAGAASVYYHYLSPWSFGTFNRGAAYSGSAFAPWALDEKPLMKAQFITKSVGCSDSTTTKMIECLKNASGNALVLAQLEMMAVRVRYYPVFGPVIESSEVSNPFIAQHPYTIAQFGGMQKLPLMTGITTEEGLMPAAGYQVDSTLLPDLEARWEQLASEIFVYNDTLHESLRPAAAKRIKQYYLADKPVSQETFSQLVEAIGDRHFKNDVGQQAQLHALYSGQPVYMSHYSYRGNFSFSEILAKNTNDYGVAHLDDVMHIFKSFEVDSNTVGDITMNAVLMQILHSYALTGVPTLPDGQYWPPLVPGSPIIDMIDIQTPFHFELKSVFDLGNKTFWDSFNFNENKNYRSDILVY